MMLQKGFSEIDYKSLGLRIRFFRKSRGLSQEQLAEYVNSSRNYIGYIETGKRTASLLLVVRIANCLEVSLEDLLSDSLEVVKNESLSKVIDALKECGEEKANILLDNLLYMQGLLSKHGIV